PCSCPFPTLLRDLPVNVFGFFEGAFGFVAFVDGDAGAADAPELVDDGETPVGAAFGGADRFAGDEDVDGVGVHLRELPQRHPTAFVDGHVERQLVNLIVGEDVFGGDGDAVDDQLDFARVAG